jgi:hypothetical protein
MCCIPFQQFCVVTVPSPLAATGVMLLPLSVTRIHFVSNGVVYFHGSEASLLLSMTVYQSVPEGSSLQGIPGVGVNPRMPS